ncbi:hypothetical protein DAETH_36660 (plasmid) [Deinococcus aetherius]|uniref:Uncharacterized protein n=1 Tax=Deinococcus aetherius TaxID=200252 RepID=A0ABM8AIQ3_9DEIO|nr:hypothetical protein [Deinococcus aetherius]BDP43697.1 hypothetical protein DAETH_36660 [Deinococcus aetherius]
MTVAVVTRLAPDTLVARPPTVRVLALTCLPPTGPTLVADGLGVLDVASHAGKRGA